MFRSSYPGSRFARRGSCWAALGALLCAAQVALAQETPPPPPPQPTPAAPVPSAQPAALDTPALLKASYESLVLPRPKADIEADLEHARSDQPRFESDIQRVRDTEAQAKDKIEIMKRDLESVKARLELAKKNKMEGERVSLETQRKSQELQRKVLERDRELKKSQVEVVESRLDEARARQRMYELELELLASRTALESLVATTIGVLPTEELVRSHRNVRELERRTLEAQRFRIDKEGEAAAKEKAFIDNQLALLRAQAEALAIR